MKRFLTLLLALMMCISSAGCSGTQKAFEASKDAYDSINTAYEITEQFASDIYEAWRMGIYEDDEVLEGGTQYLAAELNVSEDELAAGVAFTVNEIMGADDWDTLSESEKESYLSATDMYFRLFEDDLFSFCVLAVIGAYQVNGKIEATQSALDTAKQEMRELSEKYADYEHYPNMKGYYTSTSSFFEFCQNPTGSFEQVVNTINDYKNEARDYKNDLDYILRIDHSMHILPPASPSIGLHQFRMQAPINSHYYWSRQGYLLIT